MVDSKKVLLSCSHLTKEFPAEGSKKQVVHAVTDVSFPIYEGETLALVGESGCGKSTLGRLLIRLLPSTDGSIIYDGKDITKLSEKAFHPLRRDMQIIFQDPYASLDPRMNVEAILSEPLKANHVVSSKAELQERCSHLWTWLVSKGNISIAFRISFPADSGRGSASRGHLHWNLGSSSAMNRYPRLM